MPQVFVACERLDNRAGLACGQLHMLCDTGFSCITSIAADGVQREYGTRKRPNSLFWGTTAVNLAFWGSLRLPQKA